LIEWMYSAPLMDENPVLSSILIHCSKEQH
jgi:hypothetical protein